ncbi:IS1595 family transposase, partial [Nitratidesulfovibrio sp. 1201_IL3209]
LHLKECEWRYNKPLPQLIAEMKRLVAKNKDLMV